ncbi:MAG TPA: Uma2 family endonuclease [Cyclobacteriaceae bacterium]|nr:Uma2 family endonuclease [Cyclobacteriaceae bacterium]
MKPHIETPPRTIMEVYKTLPEGTLAELIDNIIYMSPSPLPIHQLILNEINLQLYQHLKSTGKGMVFIPPFDVYLDEEQNAVQPDLTIILSSNPAKVNLSRHFHGVPDVVVELLSPGNKDYDLVKKKNIYERFGVQEYWIVDPESKHTWLYELANGKYQLKAEKTASISSPLLKVDIQF